ncbi:hypothetical protein [Sideroxyarcus sp. TK5]
MKQRFMWIPVAVWMAASNSAWAEGDGYLSLGIGFDRSSGKYGGTSTIESTSIPISLRYARDDWSLKLTVPYLSVTGDGSVIINGIRGSGSGGMRMGIGMGGGGGTSTSTTTSSSRVTNSGLGDVSLFASYAVWQNEEGDAGLDAAARVKFGTASTTLGSGENDYAAQLASYASFGDFTPSLMIGYEKLGSTATAPLDNAAYGSAGLDYLLSDESNMGVEYWYAQQASATGFAQKELSLYAATQIGDAATLRAYVMKGLSDGSPDSGLGVSLSSGF